MERERIAAAIDLIKGRRCAIAADRSRFQALFEDKRAFRFSRPGRPLVLGTVAFESDWGELVRLTHDHVDPIAAGTLECR